MWSVCCFMVFTSFYRHARRFSHTIRAEIRSHFYVSLKTLIPEYIAHGRSPGKLFTLYFPLSISPGDKRETQCFRLCSWNVLCQFTLILPVAGANRCRDCKNQTFHTVPASIASLGSLASQGGAHLSRP